MRVFLDTNVLVAAFATRGLCADVLRHVLTEHALVTGEVVLAELQKALRRKLRLPGRTIREIIQFLRDQEVVPRPPAPSGAPVRDPDDRWIIASALVARADILVTGDRDLLELEGAAPLPIVDPRGFWKALRH
ncbi:MAG: putative toxin-antitoxin system toxin component, PIN family [Planctomycetes bacterium]|nr:putative toxin-antitoxin system toxin component, PIN family [Planctomycetota bacterium]